MATGCPLAPESEPAASITYGGMPKLPGAVLGPNSKTSRSNPGWCAMRTPVSCAWFAAPPALTRGHAAAGVDPGVGATDGAPLGDAVTLAPGVARAGLGVAVRGADGLGPCGSVEIVDCWCG